MKTQVNLFVDPRENNQYLVVTEANGDRESRTIESNLRDVFEDNVASWAVHGGAHIHLYTREGVLPTTFAKYLSKACYGAGSVLTFHNVR
jgi:hypothetical protein